MSDFKPTNPKDRLATSRLDLSLFPDTAVAYGALGMTEGDSKYGGYNYRVGGVLASVYYAAARRHLADWFNGENIDRKTQVPHLASAIACIAILVDAVECNVLRDDRPPKCNYRKILTEAEALVESLHRMFPDGPARFTEAANAKTHKPTKKPKVLSLQDSKSTPKARKRRRHSEKKRVV